MKLKLSAGDSVKLNFSQRKLKLPKQDLDQLTDQARTNIEQTWHSRVELKGKIIGNCVWRLCHFPLVIWFGSHPHFLIISILFKIKQPKRIQELEMDTVMICLTGMFVILMGVIAVQTAQQ